MPIAVQDRRNAPKSVALMAKRPNRFERGLLRIGLRMKRSLLPVVHADTRSRVDLPKQRLE
jgi:hypothetical protein